MLLIQATGNYGFFNLLTAALCLPLLDDGFLHYLLRRTHRVSSVVATASPAWQRFGNGLVLATLLGISSLVLIEELVRTHRMAQHNPSARANPAWITTSLNFCGTHLLDPLRSTLLTPMRSSRTINGYGLFRVMTTRREEIWVKHCPP